MHRMLSWPIVLAALMLTAMVSAAISWQVTARSYQSACFAEKREMAHETYDQLRAVTPQMPEWSRKED